MKFIAHIKADAACGHIKPHKTDREHISFWMYDNYDAVASIGKIEPLSPDKT
jgi:hypothetical protein